MLRLTQELALFGVDAFFHSLPLGSKASGYIEALVPFLQGLLASAGPNALFFHGATRALLAAVYRSSHHKTAFGLGALVIVKAELFPCRTGIAVCRCVIGHVFSATDVRAVFPLFLLFVIGGLHIQCHIGM